MIVFGLSGKAGSGKDTMAKYLCNMYGFYRVAFGDGLKDHCVSVHGWDGKKDDAGRNLLQVEGTDKHREAYPDVWVDIARVKIKMLEADGYDKIVITDMRFPNEFDFVNSFNDGYCIRIEGRKYNMGEEAENHRSETALDNHKFEFKIDSSGDIGEFHKEIWDFMVGNDFIGEKDNGSATHISLINRYF